MHVLFKNKIKNITINLSSCKSYKALSSQNSDKKKPILKKKK